MQFRTCKESIINHPFSLRASFTTFTPEIELTVRATRGLRAFWYTNYGRRSRKVSFQFTIYYKLTIFPRRNFCVYTQTYNISMYVCMHQFS